VDAAESHLEGDVSPGTASGLIRYRIWPARRHPIWTALVAAAVIAATAWVWGEWQSLIWALMVFGGLTLMGAVFLFPTLVALDGPTLHIRQFGAPRTWDLREFRRLEITDDLWRRVHINKRPTATPVDQMHGVTVPLPADRATAEQVLLHLRRWVGRAASGHFELDGDHAPQDTVI
jgi:hypothetical protein